MWRGLLIVLLSENIPMLHFYNIPQDITRFIGSWLKQRVFSVRLGTPSGTVYRRYHNPTRGVPQDGVFSPLLCLVHANRVAANTTAKMFKHVSMAPNSWRTLA